MPKSPRYLLLTKGNIKEGTKALSRLRGTSRVDGELYEILNEEKLLTEHVENYGSFGDSNEHLIGEKSLSVYDLLTSSKYYLSLFVCACVQISQQATGITVLLFYSTSFFQDAGLGCNVSRYATIRYISSLYPPFYAEVTRILVRKTDLRKCVRYTISRHILALLHFL